MNLKEIHNSIGNNRIFTFVTGVTEAKVLCGIIHNGGFDTITIPVNNESLVIVIDSPFTRKILECDIFPALADSLCALLGEVNFNLSIIPTFADGVYGKATQGQMGVLRHKMKGLLDKFGQNAVAKWLKENLELNGKIMSEERRTAICNLLGQNT